MSRRRAGVLAAVAALLLGGCAGLPTSETVEPGLPVVGAPVQDVQLLPAGPVPGADPEDILDGFLLAVVGMDDDQEVAREFLTADLGRAWRPTQQVLVFDGEPVVSRVSEDALSVSVQARGEVDETGRLVELPAQTERSGVFRMTQVEGQWRIAGFPDGFGSWMSAADFERQYRPAAVTYLAPGRDVVVPDVRWFPRGEGLPTSLARAQLQPVPEYLRGAVTTAVPEGTALAAGSVVVDETTAVATVDLTGGFPLGSVQQGEQLVAQLIQTLTQAPGVQGVQVLSDGRALEVVPDGAAPTSAAQLGYVSSAQDVPVALLRVGVGLTVVDPYRFQLNDVDLPPDSTAVTLAELPSVPIRWAHLATDAQVSELAAVSVDRRSMARWVGPSGPTEISNLGTGLTPPSFDRSGGLWVSGETGAGARVWWFDRSEPVDRVPLEVPTPWLAEGWQVRQLAVAADDQRVALHLYHPVSDEHQLGISGVLRDRDGVPVGLTEPSEVAPTLTSVATVSWVSPTELVVLGHRDGDPLELPYRVPIGGWIEPLRGVEEPVVVHGVPSADEPVLVLITERGRLYIQDRDDWVIGRNGDDLVVPGN